ncbi:MAG: HAD-IC family P-type ATPase [Rubrivivax sp.]
MTAVALWLPGSRGSAHAGRTFEVSGIGYAPGGVVRAVAADAAAVAAADDAGLAALLRAAVLCNDAELLAPEDERGTWSVLGDPTEGALLVLAAKAGLDVAALRAAAPREGELPFDADVKLMATVHAANLANASNAANTPNAVSVSPPARREIFIKGAPEAVLRLLPTGGLAAAEVRVLREAARAAADAFATRALRVLAVAVAEDDANPDAAANVEPVQDAAAFDAAAGFDAFAGRVRLLGLIGEIDPPRDEARAAVAACRRAGIRPLMVTGDHKLTGWAIARELGIARDEHGERAVDGAELERMSEPDLERALPHIAVFARVQPAQKLRIVRALQARGEVVAMTGDGVNDAPALARADVGVAMGLTGTEVAKSAARVVLTDDNFATLVAAVEQGRVVYGNLKKVILYLFATSVDEVIVLLLALLAGYPLPLAAVQILWINIVTEGTLTVNLVMDPASGREMSRPPVPRDDALFDRTMLVRTALMALTAVAAAFGWFAWRLHEGAPIDAVRTEVFTLVAVTQWFNVINCQSATASAFALGLLRNSWLLGGLLLSVALQALVLYAPALNAMFHTVPLAPATLAPLLALASSVLWVEEARKWRARWLMGAKGAKGAKR